MTELKVIIPVYNEDEIIGTVINDWVDCLTKLNTDFSIHIYNDGSKDNTLQILNSISEKDSRIIVHDKKNSGHGPTILKAYKENIDDTEWLFQIDSDNEIESKYFGELWNSRNNYDFIIGNRVYEKRVMSRQIVSWFSRRTVYFLFKRGINDVNVPYRLMRSAKFAADIKTIPDDTFAPNVIISGIAIKRKMAVKQIKVISTNRKTGEVSIKKFKLFKSAVKSFFQTFKFRLWYLK